MIAALYVEKNGPYFIDGMLPFDKEANAKTYKGPFKVICHPPCDRWGRYWGGGPMLHGTSKQKILGDDEQTFAHALWSVRTYGGVLEHPEGSHAFRYYGLPIPKQSGGWSSEDLYGGKSCCVAQGNYGHTAQKLTWLYGVNINFKELTWGKCKGLKRLDDGCHVSRKTKPIVNKKNRTSTKENVYTPEKFRDLLIEFVKQECMK